MAEIYWTEVFGGRSLAVVGRPRPGDWLDDDVEAWKVAGIHIAVSLLTESENLELGLDGEEEACRDRAIDFRSYPIVDRGVPESVEQFERLVSSLLDGIDVGKAVAVHCRAGIGRSALLAASLMIWRGNTVQESLQRVESARGLSVPDTEEQREWLDQFACRGRAVKRVRGISREGN